MHIYYLTVLMGLESGYGLNGFSSSGYLRDCNQGISWGDIYLQVWLGRICFQAHLVVVGRTQFLVGFWTESLSSSLAVGQRLPSVPCKLGCSIGQLITWKLVSSNWMRERGERERWWTRWKSAQSFIVYCMVGVGRDYTGREWISGGHHSEPFQKLPILPAFLTAPPLLMPWLLAQILCWLRLEYLPLFHTSMPLLRPFLPPKCPLYLHSYLLILTSTIQMPLLLQSLFWPDLE